MTGQYTILQIDPISLTIQLHMEYGDDSTDRTVQVDTVDNSLAITSACDAAFVQYQQERNALPVLKPSIEALVGVTKTFNS